MKKLIFIIFIFGLLSSCNERIVQLPETTNKDITEVTDVSPVYMFYGEDTDSIEFNRRNMITATNWLVNIDKRLTLQLILPHLKYLQEKRHGDGIHKNYFTCNNTDLKNLSFIEFTDVTYYEESTENYFSKVSDISENKTVIIHINSSGEISTLLFKNNKPSPLIIEKNNLLTSLKQIANESSEPIEVFINYNSELTFQEYINFKSLLLDLDEETIIISNHEFIHN